MIWHFFEVWALMLLAFAVGCPVGALAYKLIAQSPLAELQGHFADVVGDVVDGIKSRLGIGPVWRPEYRRIVERASHGADNMDDYVAPRVEGGGRQDRLPAGGGVPMIADQSVRPEAATAGTAADVFATLASGEAGETAEGEETVMARPMALAAPRNSVPDDLQRIRGIGRRIEQRLNAFGIFHFGQIAAWTPAEMRWIAQQLAFPDRIEWDDWIGQAIILAAGGDTGFVKSADRRRARRRQRALEAAIERATDADDTIDFEVGRAFGETIPDGAEASEEDEFPEDADEAADEAEAQEEAETSDEPEEAELADTPEEAELSEEVKAVDEARPPEEDTANEAAGTTEEDDLSKDNTDGEGKTA